MNLFGEGVVHVSAVVWTLLTRWSRTLWLPLIKRVLSRNRSRLEDTEVSADPQQRWRGPTCSLMLDRMMRRVILLSEAELRSLSNFLFIRYRLKAVWIVLAARRDTNCPPYFLSSISTCSTEAEAE